jgi:hypothetical protein
MKYIHEMCLRDQRGATAIVVGIMMFVFMGVAALSVDLGYVYTVRSELQNVADAAALATARKLGDIYKTSGAYDPSMDLAALVSVARDVAGKNRAGETDGINLNDADIMTGRWAENTFTADGAPSNAVRVIVRKDGSANAPVSAFFARVLGIDAVDLTATATAALSGLSKAGPGALMPFGVSEALFAYDPCDGSASYPVYFTEEMVDCFGWHTFKDPSTEVEDIFDGMSDETFESPATEAGESFSFVNDPGNVSVLQEAMIELYNNADKDADGNWRVNIVVYSPPLSPNPGDDYHADDGCKTPSPGVDRTENMIAGFATLNIKGFGFDEIYGHPLMWVDFVCDTAEDGRGNGDQGFGAWGSVPGLVE